MTGPAISASATAPAETIRSGRLTVAGDILRSRRRISELSAQLRAETQQLASLTAIAEIVGVTEVQSEKEPDVIDESARSLSTEPRQVAA